MSKKIFFSLEDVDFDDDASVEAFALRVWEQATGEFTESADNQQSESETAGERGIGDDEH